MNIDERLEKLVERHEALTQTVELTAIENRQMASGQRTTETLVREIAQGIHDLVAIVRNHEERVERLEG